MSNTKKRVSATEPIQDDAEILSKAEVIEEAIDVPPLEEVADDTISERVMSSDERRLELNLIIQGINSRKQQILESAEKSILEIKNNVEKSVLQFDELLSVYTKELNELDAKKD